MEVASAQQPFEMNQQQDAMDIDLELDLGPLPEPEVIEPLAETLTSTSDSAFPAALTTEDLQAEKVNIRGVDEFSTDDIQAFAKEHFPTEEPGRVEWIDDTSVNLIYSSANIALQALASFTQPSVGDPSSIPSLQTRVTKPLSSKPEHILQVRLAVLSDKKKPRAHEASRYYLLNPDADPRSRRQERRGGRRGGTDGDYQRRRYDDREQRRRREKDEGEDFDAAMYDDDAGDESRSRSRGGSRRGRSRGDLFEGHGRRTNGRLRNRSASPGEVDDSDEMYDDESRPRRFRERSPPPPYRARDPHPFPRANSGKELFPERSDDTTMLQSEKDLVPTNRAAAQNLKKELFPDKLQLSPAQLKHRRSDAFDAADETADLLGRRITVPMVDGNGETKSNSSKELFPSPIKDRGLSIKGNAQDPGISIRGTSNISIKGRGVKELFPSKFNANEGKELFSDKLEGRGGRRRRAEDMFT